MDLDTITNLIKNTKKYTKITENSYLKSLSIVMKTLNTKDVFFAYNNISTFYDKVQSKDSKYLLNVFRHLKSIYDNLTEELQKNVEFANYEQLKQYAKSEFYNKKDDCASSVESIPESETEIKVVNVDDDLLTHQYDELENKITEMSKKNSLVAGYCSSSMQTSRS